MSSSIQLGDREELHDVAEAGRVGDVLGRHAARSPRGRRRRSSTRASNAIDARIAHFAAASNPSTSAVGSASAYPRRCASASASSKPQPSLGHLREDVVRRAVHDAEHPGDAIAGQRLAQRPDQGDAPGHRGLERQVGGARVGGGLQLGAGAREQLLVPGDDGLARGERPQHQRPGGLEPAEQLQDHLDIRVVDDRRAVGGEDVGRPAACRGARSRSRTATRAICNRTPARRAIASACSCSGARDGRSDRAAAEHADPDQPFAHVPPSPLAAETAGASHGVPSMTSRRSMSSGSSRRIHGVARPSRTPTTAGRPNRL